MTTEEEVRLMNHLNGRLARIAPIVVLALQTGMRRGEILSMKWAHVNLSASVNQLEVNGERHEIPPDAVLIPQSKSGRSRVAPLSMVARQTLLSLEIGVCADYVFSSVVTGLRVTHLKRAFKRACLDARITDLTSHYLRRTWATRAAQAGVDAFTIRDVLGHANVRMTNDYAHSTTSSQRRAVEAVGGLRLPLQQNYSKSPGGEAKGSRAEDVSPLLLLFSW